MSAKPTRKRSRRTEQPVRGRANLGRLRATSEETIERTSPPELKGLPPDFWADAAIVEPVGKQPISLRVDSDVLEWFKQQGPRYQSRMNAVLRAYMAAVRARSRRKRAG